MILLTVELVVDVAVAVVVTLQMLTVGFTVDHGWRQIGCSVAHQLGHELLGEVLGIGGRSGSVGMKDLVPVSSILLGPPGPPAHYRSLTTSRRLQNLVESAASGERIDMLMRCEVGFTKNRSNLLTVRVRLFPDLTMVS